MATDKASFLLYRDIKPMVDKLSDEQAGRLLKHILAYVNDEAPELDDQLLQIAFEPIKQSLKRDLKKWEDKREKARDAGRKGGLKRVENLKQKQAYQANALNAKRPQADQAVSVSVSVIDIYNNHTDYVNNLKKNKETEYAGWLDGVCRKHGLQLSRIWRVFDKFKEHLKATNKTHDDLGSFKKHFVNWLDKQDQAGMLEQYKHRKMGSL